MANPQSRRVPVYIGSLIALVAAGGLSFAGARAAADFIEARGTREAAQALHAAGYDWAQVSADGLQIRLTGTAPDEVQRFRAKSRAEAAVDAGRVVDEMQVAPRRAVIAPDFEVELLRNDDGISIVGLVPATLDRAAMVDTLKRRTGAATISDLVETADYAEPDTWPQAFAFGLKAAELAPRAKVSITPGAVVVRAITDSPEQKLSLQRALDAAKPKGITLTSEITAPRPVISPFTLRFVKDMAGARFDACAADTDAARARITDAAAKAGVAGAPQCTLGLGAPSGAWADAAVAAIQAIDDLGAGSVTLTDTDVALYSPASVAPAAFDEAVGGLRAALPDGFALKAVHETKSAADAGPAQFSASANAGRVTLQGRIANERMRDAVESLARSRFGHVNSALVVDDSVPEGWTLRVIAGIEALSGLTRGTATVTPDLLTLTGVSGSQTASDIAAARLAQRLDAGARYEMSIRYDRRMDPLLGLPTGLECVDALNNEMSASEIGFEPNKALIAGDPKPTLDSLATTMKDCADFRIEIGGHTDSQGSEGFNAELSRSRAQAVLEAMGKDGIDITNMSAKGYGESQPIAENDTDAGREANRRIEFTLLSDEPVVTETPRPAEKVAGVTDSAAEVAARSETAAANAATVLLDNLIAEPPAATAPGHESPAAIAATTASAAVAMGGIVADVTRALTIPAVETVFPGDVGPDDEQGRAANAQAQVIPLADLPEIVPLGPPDVQKAVGGTAMTARPPARPAE